MWRNNLGLTIIFLYNTEQNALTATSSALPRTAQSFCKKANTLKYHLLSPLHAN